MLVEINRNVFSTRRDRVMLYIMKCKHTQICRALFVMSRRLISVVKLWDWYESMALSGGEILCSKKLYSMKDLVCCVSVRSWLACLVLLFVQVIEGL